MPKDQIELRDDGIYTIRDVLGKPLERKVERGWHVLFTDKEGQSRLGFVGKISAGTCELYIMDDVLFPNAPSPTDEPYEVIDWSQVLEAGSGFCRPKRTVYTEKKHGVREVWCLSEASEVGFIATRNPYSIRLYVDLKETKWEVR